MWFVLHSTNLCQEDDKGFCGIFGLDWLVFRTNSWFSHSFIFFFLIFLLINFFFIVLALSLVCLFHFCLFFFPVSLYIKNHSKLLVTTIKHTGKVGYNVGSYQINHKRVIYSIETELYTEKDLRGGSLTFKNFSSNVQAGS